MLVQPEGRLFTFSIELFSRLFAATGQYQGLPFQIKIFNAAIMLISGLGTISNSSALILIF